MSAAQKPCQPSNLRFAQVFGTGQFRSAKFCFSRSSEAVQPDRVMVAAVLVCVFPEGAGRGAKKVKPPAARPSLGGKTGGVGGTGGSGLPSCAVSFLGWGGSRGLPSCAVSFLGWQFFLLGVFHEFSCLCHVFFPLAREGCQLKNFFVFLALLRLSPVLARLWPRKSPGF